MHTTDLGWAGLEKYQPAGPCPPPAPAWLVAAILLFGSDRHPSHLRRPPTQIMNRNSLTILVVEDHPTIARQIVDFLDGLKWQPDHAATGALAIELEVHLSTTAMRAAGTAPHRLSRGVASNMYWTIAQIVTHHASNGCNLAPGDLLGTGTISAPDDRGYGSLLEISRGGSQPVTLPGGETRSFLEDGDEVTLTARAVADGHVPIGFGACSAIILPARP